MQVGAGIRNVFVQNTNIQDNAVTDSKIAIGGLTIAKMANEGTAAQVLTSNGAGSHPTYQSVAAGSQDLVKIETKTMVAKASSLTSSAITGATYSGFRIQYYWEQEDGAGAPAFRFNNDSGASQYISNSLARVSATITAGNRSLTNGELFNATNLLDGMFGYGIIEITNLANGYRHWNAKSISDSGEECENTGYWKSTSDISTFSLIATANNGAIGSTFTIWGYKK